MSGGGGGGGVEPSVERMGAAQAIARMMSLRPRMSKGDAQGLIEIANARGIAPSSLWQLIVVSPELGLYTVQEHY